MILCGIATAAVLLACCTGGGNGMQATHPASRADFQGNVTPADLRDYVQDAAAFARSQGKESALAEFSRKDGKFSAGNLYIYAYDMNGTLLAHPYQAESVGQNRGNLTDIRGLHMIAIANQTASSGGGFIAYLYPAPEGGVINETRNDTYVPKIGYVAPVDSTYWIGSGIYFSDLSGADPVPEPVASMIDLEQKGAAFGREYGKDAALQEIMNRSGVFFDKEGHYLTGYDYNGTVLSHPYLKDAIGKSLIGRKDAFGMEIVRSAAETARSGGGYVVFIWPNPAAGNREELKIGYMLPVDETWWIGSGVYLSEITGDPHYF
jgi:two-component system, NarL family, sensor kinase